MGLAAERVGQHKVGRWGSQVLAPDALKRHDVLDARVFGVLRPALQPPSSHRARAASDPAGLSFPSPILSTTDRHVVTQICTLSCSPIQLSALLLYFFF